MAHEPARNAIRTLLPGALILAAGVVAYAGSLSGPFIFDDLDSISGNPYIRHLWPPAWLFRAPVETGAAGRPIVSLSLAINYAIDGLDVRSYHLFNVAMHLLCALLLLGIVRRTLLRSTFGERYGRSAPWLAGAVALLWTVHPLQTESVTYIIQRTELLMGLFYLLTLYCAIRSWESARHRAWFAAAVFACALGMGCKEVMASAPLIVLLYDRTFVNGSFGAALRRHVGLYLGLAATWLVLGALVAAGARRQTVGFDLHIGALDYLRTQAQVIVWYLRLGFWPDPLVISYGWPVIRTWSECAIPGLMILSLLAATLWAVWRRAAAGFLGAWFFAILAPSSSFVPIVTEIAAERRMYLPLAAVVALCVLVSWRVLEYAATRFSTWDPLDRQIGGTAAIVIAAALSGATVQRNEDYRSVVSIWTDAVAKRPAVVESLSNLGAALMNDGQVEPAIEVLERALAIDDTRAATHTNLARALMARGRVEEAVRHSRKAVALSPDSAFPHFNLGEVYQYMHRDRDARVEYASALAIAEKTGDAALARLARENINSLDESPRAK